MPLNIDWQQILLHLFNFVILFAILYLLLYKPVKRFMEERTEYYKNLDEEAKAKLADAEETKAEYTGRLAAAEEEIAENKNRAHRELEAASAAKILETQAEAEQIIAQARACAERERVKILRQAQREITDMVTEAAEKLVSGEEAGDVFDQFLSAAQRGGNDE